MSHYMRKIEQHPTALRARGEDARKQPASSASDIHHRAGLAEVVRGHDGFVLTPANAAERVVVEGRRVGMLRVILEARAAEDVAEGRVAGSQAVLHGAQPGNLADRGGLPSIAASSKSTRASTRRAAAANRTERGNRRRMGL